MSAGGGMDGMSPGTLIAGLIIGIIILVLVAGCSIQIDTQAYTEKTEKFCEPCGGLTAAFINEYGKHIICKDGTKLDSKWPSIPKVLVIGECK